MKINLLNSRNIYTTTEVEFFSYPDSQQGIGNIKNLDLYQNICDITISIKSFLDIEKLILVVKSIRVRNPTITINLFIKYLLGARSDRRFHPTDVIYISEVIAPIINSLNLTSVKILDPHSDVSVACINNCTAISNVDFVTDVINSINVHKVAKKLSEEEWLGPNDRIRASNSVYLKTEVLKNLVLISPDAGSQKKIDNVAKQLNFEVPIITCEKQRNVLTGEITGTKIHSDLLAADLEGKTLLIIDDICDGGRTFIEIAKAIRSQYKSDFDMALAVTHGIFSKGIEPLVEYFSQIFCTDSFTETSNHKQLTII